MTQTTAPDRRATDEPAARLEARISALRDNRDDTAVLLARAFIEGNMLKAQTYARRFKADEDMIIELTGARA